jgi:hypothetical protein
MPITDCGVDPYGSAIAESLSTCMGTISVRLELPHVFAQWTMVYLNLGQKAATTRI